MILINFSFVLVKAFLAKAKDEFQAKYDKPGQVLYSENNLPFIIV